MDVGIYCLNASRYLTGEEPVEVKGYSSVVDRDGRFAEVEENVAWTMKFPSGDAGELRVHLRSEHAGIFPGVRFEGDSDR